MAHRKAVLEHYEMLDGTTEKLPGLGISRGAYVLDDKWHLLPGATPERLENQDADVPEL
jgi:hypothetical protein